MREGGARKSNFPTDRQPPSSRGLIYKTAIYQGKIDNKQHLFLRVPQAWQFCLETCGSSQKRRFRRSPSRHAFSFLSLQLALLFLIRNFMHSQITPSCCVQPADRYPPSPLFAPTIKYSIFLSYSPELRWKKQGTEVQRQTESSLRLQHPSFPSIHSLADGVSLLLRPLRPPASPAMAGGGPTGRRAADRRWRGFRRSLPNTHTLE